MARIVFYCRDTLDNIQSMEYYRQDLEALKALGHEVVICNKYRQIPLHFDAMFIWWWTYALAPIVWARALGRKAFIAGVFNFRFENAASGTDFFARPWLQRVVISLAARLAHANLFVSRREFDEVPAYFGLGNAFYTPCAVGDDYFAAARRGEERSIMLNLAWSGPDNLQRKGVWTILDAAALLKARGQTFKLVLGGKRGAAYPALLKKIAELGLEDCVTAVGEVTYQEKLDLFSRTRLYLQPSFFEGFGLATAEAMAAGCCVITTDTGEVSTVVGDAGAYVQPGDARGLADTIEALLANPNRMGDLAARASDRMRVLFSFEQKKATFARVLTELGVQSRSS